MGTYPYKGKDNTRRNRVSLAGESPVPASCRSRLVSRKGVRCEARSELLVPQGGKAGLQNTVPTNRNRIARLCREGKIAQHIIPLEARIQKLNRLMKGWVNYFKYATGYEKFDRLDGWIRNRLRYCIWKAWKRPRRRLRAILQLGISKDWAIRFAYSRKGGWRPACSPVMGMRVTEERLSRHGYISFKSYYHKVRQTVVVP